MEAAIPQISQGCRFFVSTKRIEDDKISKAVMALDDSAGILVCDRSVVVCHVWMCTCTVCSSGDYKDGQCV